MATKFKYIAVVVLIITEIFRSFKSSSIDGLKIGDGVKETIFYCIISIGFASNFQFTYSSVLGYS